MQKQNSLVPALIGTVLVVLGVGITGSTFVQDNHPGDWHWLAASSAPFRWQIDPGGRDLDLYIGINLIPVTFVLASAGLLVLATRRRDRWSFATLFFGSWGALVGAGVIAATLFTLYSNVVLDGGSFVRGRHGFLNEWHFNNAWIIDGAAFAGLFVALAVSVTGAMIGAADSTTDGDDRAPFAGGPLDPSPPIGGYEAPAANPMPHLPPPPTS